MQSLLPTYARHNIAFARGEGTELFTAAGERYLDFAGGVAVVALGHAHPHLVRALTEQAQKLWHTSNLFRIDNQERLAARLCEATFADRVFFGNSGAEAIECALKMARHYHFHRGQPERFRTITFDGAFHGRTLATIAAGNQKKHLEGFGPKADGFDCVGDLDIRAVEAAIGPTTAAVLIEPIQGEGGIRVVPHQFLRELRALADQRGILVIFDEIQCGMGRTGRLFAHEWAGVTPDLMAIAKGLGGGFPIGACLATARAAEGMTAGTHGSTFGGNLLATAVGNAVLDVVLAPGFLEDVNRKGEDFGKSLAAVAARHPGLVDGIRGTGLMRGLKGGKATNGDIVKALLEQKLLSVPGGDNVVRLLPPLTVTAREIEEACDRIDVALTHLTAAAAAAQ